ncbi:MAG: hypothetical protein AB1777_11400 [Bacteroidota bacterium]
MKKVRALLSFNFLVLFILPLVSKVLDAYFHHHHHEIEHVNQAANLTQQHPKCLIFQYELVVFEPQTTIPKTEAYFNTITRISVLVISNFYTDNLDIKNPRAPPFCKT